MNINTTHARHKQTNNNVRAQHTRTKGLPPDAVERADDDARRPRGRDLQGRVRAQQALGRLLAHRWVVGGAAGGGAPLCCLCGSRRRGADKQTHTPAQATKQTHTQNNKHPRRGTPRGQKPLQHAHHDRRRRRDQARVPVRCVVVGKGAVLSTAGEGGRQRGGARRLCASPRLPARCAPPPPH